MSSLSVHLNLYFCVWTVIICYQSIAMWSRCTEPWRKIQRAHNSSWWNMTSFLGERMYAESLFKDACSVSKRVMKLQRLKGFLWTSYPCHWRKQHRHSPKDIVARNTFEEKSIIIIHGHVGWVDLSQEHIWKEVNTADEDSESNLCL